MNLIKRTSISVPFAEEASAIVSKISNVHNTCEYSKNLTIGIYLVEKNHFFYCNRRLKNILGDKFNTLMRDGWDFWFSLIDANEVLSIKKKIAQFFTNSTEFDALRLDYRMTDTSGKGIYMKHEILLHKIRQHTFAINYFFRSLEYKEEMEILTEGSAVYDDPLFLERKELKISGREYEVLELIGDGYSSKEIADILFISNHTVISHRKNLIEKFKAKNTAHLIKKALLKTRPFA